MGAVGRFPLSERASRESARKLGYHVGQKRARALARRLVEAGITERPANTAKSTTTPRDATASTSACSGWPTP